MLTVAKTDKYQSGASDQIRKGWLELARAGGTFINDVISIYQLNYEFKKLSEIGEKLIMPRDLLDGVIFQDPEMALAFMFCSTTTKMFYQILGNK